MPEKVITLARKSQRGASGETRTAPRSFIFCYLSQSLNFTAFEISNDTAYSVQVSKGHAIYPRIAIAQAARYPGVVIPVIDLFAGPGGLGEGFASRLDRRSRRIFKIALSVEMDPAARATLRLRSFFRQFEPGQLPEEYYEVLRGKLSLDGLYEKYPSQATSSDAEAWKAELGKVDPAEVDRRIKDALAGARDWVLIGGPPCQAYSLVGRARVINVDREKYENDGRHTLYKQYLRILKVHRPPFFVMENVKGILSSKLDGNLIVDKILADLQFPLGRKTRPSDAQ